MSHAINFTSSCFFLQRNGQPISANTHMAHVLYSVLHMLEQSSRKHWFRLEQYPSDSNSSHNVASELLPVLESFDADTVQSMQFSDSILVKLAMLRRQESTVFDSL